jgi:hypothetical protein
LRRIVVLGGYGAFGRRVAERLARSADIEVVVAGRSHDRAAAAAAEIGGAMGARLRALCLDADTISAAEIAAARAAVLVHAAGPYQHQDYKVARACIAAGVHYLDLADARTFATGIGALDSEARRADVLAVSGASTVPAVSGAVVDAYAGAFGALQSVTTVIAPGNSFDPGLATTRSILGTLGQPLAADKGKHAARGWQGLQRHVIPGLGTRWTSHCDAPDLDLFPARYASLESAAVRAALEVGAFHLGLWALSWLVRSGLLASPERLAAPLLTAKRRLGFLGSDRGGMLVALEGLDRDGKPTSIAWSLVAGSGHGPYVPVTPAVLLAKRLARGALQARGAMPCLGLFTLADFLAEVGDLDMHASTA